MQTQVVLTVAESKRLIARGVAACKAVREAMVGGTIALAKGSTNSYVYEELTGRSIARCDYMTGRTVPSRETNRAKGARFSSEIADLVLRKGRPVEGLSATDALKEMSEGDVFMKGANAINWRKLQAALLIGHPTGGTWGSAVGTCVAKRIRVIIPAGLEKDMSADLVEAAREVASPGERIGQNVALWPMSGELFTEVEALAALAGVEAMPIASGGVAGAEGAVRLLVRGPAAEVEKALAAVESVLGEPPFAG